MHVYSFYCWFLQAQGVYEHLRGCLPSLMGLLPNEPWWQPRPSVSLPALAPKPSPQAIASENLTGSLPEAGVCACFGVFLHDTLPNRVDCVQGVASLSAHDHPSAHHPFAPHQGDDFSTSALAAFHAESVFFPDYSCKLVARLGYVDPDGVCACVLSLFSIPPHCCVFVGQALRGGRCTLVFARSVRVEVCFTRTLAAPCRSCGLSCRWSVRPQRRCRIALFRTGSGARLRQPCTMAVCPARSHCLRQT